MTNNGIIQSGGTLKTGVLAVGENATVKIDNRFSAPVLSPENIESDKRQTVFISYRRKDSSYIARSIFMDLQERGHDVFMDIESIDSGRFDSIIQSEISSRTNFIIVLTRESVKRFVDPEDYLRREIEHAMCHTRNIIPVLVDGFSFKVSGKYLHGQLSKLSSYNALNISHEYFKEALEKLRVRFLNQPNLTK